MSQHLPRRDRGLLEREGPESISDRDQVTEDFIKMAVKKVFVDAKLTNSEYELCRDLFKLANGRLLFAKALEDSKVKFQVESLTIGSPKGPPFLMPPSI